MRIAVLIIGLLLGAFMFMQSAVLAVAGDTDISAGGAIGLIVAFCWLICCALVLSFPLVSTIGFVVSAFFAMIAATTGFSDMWLWCAVSVALALMSFFGWKGKKRSDREKSIERDRQNQRDAMFERVMQQQA